MITIVITNINYYVEFYISTISMSHYGLAAVSQHKVIRILQRHFDCGHCLERVAIIGMQISMDCELCIAYHLSFLLCEFLPITFFFKGQFPYFIGNSHKFHFIQRILLVVISNKLYLKLQAHCTRVQMHSIQKHPSTLPSEIRNPDTLRIGLTRRREDESEETEENE